MSPPPSGPPLLPLYLRVCTLVSEGGLAIVVWQQGGGRTVMKGTADNVLTAATVTYSTTSKIRPPFGPCKVISILQSNITRLDVFATKPKRSLYRGGRLAGSTVLQLSEVCSKHTHVYKRVPTEDTLYVSVTWCRGEVVL